MSDVMDYELDKILLTREEIARRVGELSAQISAEFRGETVTFVGILKGASIFLADLVRAVSPEVDVRLDFMAVSSYGSSTTSSGAVKIVKDMDTFAEGKNIIIVEDIMDTGYTLNYLQGVIDARSPSALRTCVLLDKPDRKKADCTIDMKGFTIPDVFVVGYGLDYAGRWRNLPDIWSLRAI